MIEAKELRIGNLVTINNEHYHPKLKGLSLVVIGIKEAINTFYSIDVRDEESELSYSQYSKYIQPIEITDEWLLYFGFRKFKKEFNINGYEYTLQVTDDYGEEEINRDGTWFNAIGSRTWKNDKTLVVSPLCRGNYVSNNIQFVHQLQNLYYSLTGEELIKKTD